MFILLFILILSWFLYASPQKHKPKSLFQSINVSPKGDTDGV